MVETKIDGILMHIPDSITTETLLQRSQAEAGDIAYRIDPYGNQQVLMPGQEVEVRDGDRFGTISRFRTGGS